MIRGIGRAAVLGAAALFAMGSASSQSNTNNNQNNKSGSAVTVKVPLDSSANTIPLFEAGAHKASCEAAKGEKDGMQMAVVKCGSDSIVIVQSGAELLLACPSNSFTQNQCSQFAINLLEGRRR